jgi:hypothetical protein
MDEQDTVTRWVDGRIVDGEPRPPGSPWAWMLSVLAVVLTVDLILGLGPTEPPTASAPELGHSPAQLRAEIEQAAAAARSGRPALLLVGDSVLVGDVMAERFADWRTQRVVDHMRAELSESSDAELRQVALDALLPVDALHVLAELDRLDPAGEVHFVLELNLRYFSDQYAEQRGCTRPELCALGRTRLAADNWPGERAAAGVLESVGLVRDQLVGRAPIHRHRARLHAAPELGELDELTTARPPEPDAEATAKRRAEGLARVRPHYRETSPTEPGAQVVALEALVDRLVARSRKATMFLTPLEDEFVNTVGQAHLGRRYGQIATLIHERTGGSSLVELVNLDHPLFESAYFIDHVHLDPAGNRLLAINLLHELGLPLRARPFPWMMVHGEDHDRSLIHRRALGNVDGGAWQALVRSPNGVAASRSGDWIVFADTGNHLLRQLRGSMQVVERLAGAANRSVGAEGPALAVRLDQPRSPVIVGDAVYFLDGRRSERVRELAAGAVRTLRWVGPSCRSYTQIATQAVEGRTRLLLLCSDARVLSVDLGAPHRATSSFDPRSLGAKQPAIRAIAATDDGRLLLADGDSRIWAVRVGADGSGDAPTLVFANEASELLPQGLGLTYPFRFDEQRVNRIVGMQWVERYGALLIQDAHDLGKYDKRLRSEETERVHLRLLDLDHELIWPWIKPIPHAEAFHMWNAYSSNLVSYYHFGSMAVVQADASLLYLERERSRLTRIADGMLGVAKAGGVHTADSKVELYQPISSETARLVGASMRPDRFLSTRHEPIARAGPYVALLVGSSLSSISDRLGNYSLGRLLELELQAELGYRDVVFFGLFQRSHDRLTLANIVEEFEDFVRDSGPPPDVVLFELHGVGLAGANPGAALTRIAALAAIHDTQVIFYDNSALEADGRDGLRASSPALRGLIETIRARGFVVLEPSDRLLRELLVESPWGNQTWEPGQRHGAPWAIELTARALASMAYPHVRELVRRREPARDLAARSRMQPGDGSP